MPNFTLQQPAPNYTLEQLIAQLQAAADQAAETLQRLDMSSKGALTQAARLQGRTEAMRQAAAWAKGVASA